MEAALVIYTVDAFRVVCKSLEGFKVCNSLDHSAMEAALEVNTVDAFRVLCRSLEG